MRNQNEIKIKCIAAVATSLFVIRLSKNKLHKEEEIRKAHL